MPYIEWLKESTQNKNPIFQNCRENVTFVKFSIDKYSLLIKMDELHFLLLIFEQINKI